MTELVELIVKQFVTVPEKFRILTADEGDSVTLTVVLADEDMGKVIGKQGRIAKAIRTIVKAASAKDSKHYNVEIVEESELAE